MSPSQHWQPIRHSPPQISRRRRLSKLTLSTSDSPTALPRFTSNTEAYLHSQGQNIPLNNTQSSPQAHNQPIGWQSQLQTWATTALNQGETEILQLASLSLKRY